LKKIFLSALAASLLASCAHHRFEHGLRYMDPTRPMVNVVGGQFLVVNQEPLVFLRDQRDVTITWQLPPGANLRFARDGVVIEKGGDEFVNCGVRDDGQRFSCVNRHTKPGKYNYTIRVLAGGKVLQSDPFIMNQ
jgi:hypothetical protein